MLLTLLVVSLLSNVVACVLLVFQRDGLALLGRTHKSALNVIVAQKDLIEGQETSIKGLRSYMEFKEATLFDSIEKLVTNLRFWMPDESQVVPDKEGDQWYSSVNAIFEAEKRVRDIKESR